MRAHNPSAYFLSLAKSTEFCRAPERKFVATHNNALRMLSRSVMAAHVSATQPQKKCKKSCGPVTPWINTHQCHPRKNRRHRSTDGYLRTRTYCVWTMSVLIWECTLTLLCVMSYRTSSLH